MLNAATDVLSRTLCIKVHTCSTHTRKKKPATKFSECKCQQKAIQKAYADAAQRGFSYRWIRWPEEMFAYL